MFGGNETEAGYQPSLVHGKASKFVVLSGCSGAGKSSLLAELGRRGFPIYEEPGRQVVKEQLYIGGNALPWGDWRLFVELTISRSIYHIVTAARRDRLSFFDRGIVDQVSGLERRGLSIPEHLAAAVDRFRYHEKVFMMPPWPEIFSNDNERKHSFEDALSSYERLLVSYERFGYQIVLVPRLGISARADFVLNQLKRKPGVSRAIKA
jgi:predicted ATPase